MKVMKYGWIMGIICLPLGGLHLYYYFSGTGTSGLAHLVIGIFGLFAGIFNLALYRADKDLRELK